MRQTTLAVVMSVLAVASSKGRCDDLGRPDEALLRAIAEGYTDNRQRFEAFTCRFTIADGAAHDTQEVLNGKVALSLIANGLWIVNGMRERFELVSPVDLRSTIAELVTSAPESDAIGVPFLGTMLLGDGQFQLRVTPEVAIANIFTPASPGRAPEPTPFEFGVLTGEALSPPRLIESALSGNGFCAVSQKPQNARQFVLTYGMAHDAINMEFVLDEEHGFMPAEITSTNAQTRQITSRVFVTSYLKCGNGGWAPERSLNMLYADGLPVRAREIKIVEIETAPRPDAKQFTLAVPAGVVINDPTGIGTQARIERPLSFGIEDLPTIPDRIRRALPPPEVARQPPSFALSVFVLVNALILAILAGFFLMRRRSRRVT